MYLSKATAELVKRDSRIHVKLRMVRVLQNTVCLLVLDAVKIKDPLPNVVIRQMIRSDAAINEMNTKVPDLWVFRR